MSSAAGHGVGSGVIRSGLDSVAHKPGLELLVRRQPAQIDAWLAIWQRHRGRCWGAQAVRIGHVIAGYGAGNQPTVIPPIETYPGFEETCFPVFGIEHEWSR